MSCDSFKETSVSRTTNLSTKRKWNKNGLLGEVSLMWSGDTDYLCGGETWASNKYNQTWPNNVHGFLNSLLDKKRNNNVWKNYHICSIQTMLTIIHDRRQIEHLERMTESWNYKLLCNLSLYWQNKGTHKIELDLICGLIHSHYSVGKYLVYKYTIMQYKFNPNKSHHI